MAENDIAPIDLIVVNLYAFEETVRGGADFATCVENIDIGGPALIRAAAKNHNFTTIVIDPQYQSVMVDMEAHAGGTTEELRKTLAATAYARTAAYDTAIATWFSGQVDEPYLEFFALGGRLQQKYVTVRIPSNGGILFVIGIPSRRVDFGSGPRQRSQLQ